MAGVGHARMRVLANTGEISKCRREERPAGVAQKHRAVQRAEERHIASEEQGVKDHGGRSEAAFKT